MAIPSNVSLIKFPVLDEVDEALFTTALEHFFRKVSVDEKDCQLSLSMKEYKKGGLRSQHELHASLRLGNKSFFAHETGWLLLEVVQSVLKKLEKEVLKQHSK